MELMFRHKTLIVRAFAFISVVSAAEVTATLTPTDQRKPVPAFALKNSDGKTVTSRDLIGKVVLLNFWATECGGCRQELPSFIELDRAYRAKALKSSASRWTSCTKVSRTQTPAGRQ